MDNKWKNIIGAISVIIILTLGITVVGKTAISELAGIAVAQTDTLWNSVADAAKGDGLTTGIMATSSYLYNGVTFNRSRGAPLTDSVATTGLPASVIELFNGTTYDRMRSASGDALPITGIIGTGNLVWNGASNDRQRSASATNNTTPASSGALQVTPLSTWSVINTTAASATAATISKTAGGGTVRHVATGVTACYFDTAVGAANRIVNLRDGAAGAGTILRTFFINVVVANDTKCEHITGINMTGSANTAMTIEFASAPPGATGSETVTLTGYSTP